MLTQRNTALSVRLKKFNPAFRRWLLAVLFSCAGAVPVLAASYNALPLITNPPTQLNHPGKVVFAELVTPDIAATERFYGSLFGWSFNNIPNGTMVYIEALHDGHPVAGLIQRVMMPGESRRPAWLTFISSRDVDAETGLALHNGARILFGPQDVPDRGREAILADPQGAVFAMLDSSSGDPPDILPAQGEWIWSSLITHDAEDAAGFYQQLFDYEVFDLSSDESPDGPSGENGQHLLLASGSYARASVNSLPNGEGYPHWLNYIRVRDTARMAARAAALGGRILVGPQVDRHGGKIAVIADPSGAVFGLLEWPNMDINQAEVIQ